VAISGHQRQEASIGPSSPKAAYLMLAPLNARHLARQ
jgi:hypothetical protein